MPGLVLSSAFCCLDLLLWSWYKYHTFSWTAYSWSTELKTKIKRGGVPSKHQDITEWKRSYFMLHYWFGSCTLVLFLWMIHGDYTCGLHEVGPVFLHWTFEKLWEEFHLRLQPELQSHFPLAVWGPQLKSRYIQSKCWKVVYDSFLFRLSVWNLCGLKVSRNPVAGYAVWDLLSPDKHLHVWRLRDFRLSREV